MAQNFVFQSLRGAARRRAREACAARPESAPSDAPLDPDLRRRVLEAVRALEEPNRSAVHLRFFEDLPPTAIAHRLGTRPETVRTRIKRGLAQVQSRLRARS
ncbi:MAG: sigma-70 family RNA polymerase sigma factor [Planctomycetes bacterium]|nr:sigma-70 family RNA polymerase sigma factor [Planctomycetota bacterium]